LTMRETCSFFFSYFGSGYCLLFLLGSLPYWANRWGCHSELADLQREEICGYQQRGSGIGWENAYACSEWLSLFDYFHRIELKISLFIVAGDEEEETKETKQEFTLLCDWVKQQLGDKVAKVQISKRLSSSPCVLVSGKFGWSANMER